MVRLSGPTALHTKGALHLGLVQLLTDGHIHNGPGAFHAVASQHVDGVRAVHAFRDVLWRLGTNRVVKG